MILNANYSDYSPQSCFLDYTTIQFWMAEMTKKLQNRLTSWTVLKFAALFQITLRSLLLKEATFDLR